jgi:cytoskeleton protein RodZ
MSLLGERLRQAREARGITPLQVEIDTRIRASVIQALEQGDYGSLPPEPFLRGLVRTYANYLRVDSEEMVQLFAADFAGLSPSAQPAAPTEPPPQFTPPPAAPEKVAPALTASLSPPSASEPVRRPTAIRVPSLRPPLPRPPAPKPNLPVPAAPPESISSPETLAATGDLSPETTMPEHFARAHTTRRPAPLPMILLILGVIACICLFSGIVVFSQAGTAFQQLVELGKTPTIKPPTRNPTAQSGANPTNVPTLAATAPPFAPFPGNPTPTLGPAPHSVSETYVGLNLDMAVTQTVNIRVGIDGVLVFNGEMQPGSSRSWSAKDTLYVRIENPKGAIAELNGSNKYFSARNYAETRLIERQWNINDKGTPLPITPIPPPTLPGSTPPPTLFLVLPTPTPTLTPFS